MKKISIYQITWVDITAYSEWTSEDNMNLTECISIGSIKVVNRKGIDCYLVLSDFTADGDKSGSIIPFSNVIRKKKIGTATI